MESVKIGNFKYNSLLVRKNHHNTKSTLSTFCLGNIPLSYLHLSKKVWTGGEEKRNRVRFNERG